MSKYHITSDGVVKICRAVKGQCPFGGDSRHFNNPTDAQNFLNAEIEGYKNFERIQHMSHIDKFKMFGLDNNPRTSSEIYEYYTVISRMKSNMMELGCANQMVYLPDSMDNQDKYNELNEYISNNIHGLSIDRTRMVGEDDQFVYVWANDNYFDDVFVIDKDSGAIEAIEVKNLSGDGVDIAGAQLGNWTGLNEHPDQKGIDYFADPVMMRVEKDFPETAEHLKAAMDNWDSNRNAYENTVLLSGQDAVNYLISKQRYEASREIGNCNSATFAVTFDTSGENMQYYDLSDYNLEQASKDIKRDIDVDIVVRANHTYNKASSGDRLIMSKYKRMFKDMDSIKDRDFDSINVGKDLNYELYKAKDKRDKSPGIVNGNKALITYNSSKVVNGETVYNGVQVRMGSFRYKHTGAVKLKDLNDITIDKDKLEYAAPIITGSLHPSKIHNTSFDNLRRYMSVEKRVYESLNNAGYSHSVQGVFSGPQTKTSKRFADNIDISKLGEAYEARINPVKANKYAIKNAKYNENNMVLNESDRWKMFNKTIFELRNEAMGRKKK